MSESPARDLERLTGVVAGMNAGAPVSAALFDAQGGLHWAFEGDRWFHAASTIKIAVLAAVSVALEDRRLDSRHRLEIRNDFASAAGGGRYRVQASRDTDTAVHSAIGGTMSVGELAHRMIAVSSNLATNVLLEFVGGEHARWTLASAGVTGIDLVRGVEDDRAFEAGISNRATANGLVGLLRAMLDGRFGSQERTAEMLAILAAQTFRRGIPAGLSPAARASARIAHKTGEMSSATHDAGIVFLENRAPYVLAVLTGMPGDEGDRYAPIARVSAEVFALLSRR